MVATDAVCHTGIGGSGDLTCGKAMSQRIAARLNGDA